MCGENATPILRRVRDFFHTSKAWGLLGPRGVIFSSLVNLGLLVLVTPTPKGVWGVYHLPKWVPGVGKTVSLLGGLPEAKYR